LDIPPGTYTVKAWHEGLGKFDKPITIKAGETTNWIFQLKEISLPKSTGDL